MLAGITFAAHGELHAFGYPFRDVYGNNFFTVDDSFTGTFLTFILDNFAFAATGRTGGACLHRSENGLLVADYRTATFTGRTGFRAAVSLCTGSVTVAAGYILFQFEFLLYSGRNLLEVQLHLNA